MFNNSNMKKSQETGFKNPKPAYGYAMENKSDI